MSLEMLFIPSDGTYSANDLKPVGDGALALKARTAEGEIVALGHMDDITTDTTNNTARWFTESAYGGQFMAHYARWDNVNQLLGAACAFLPVNYGGLCLPYNARWNNLAEFTVDIYFRPTSLTTGVIVNELIFGTGYTAGRWSLNTVGTSPNAELHLYLYASDGSYTDLATSGLGMTNNTRYHIRIAYKAATTSATISVNGVQVATTATAKVLATLGAVNCPMIALGGRQTPAATGMAFGISALGQYEEFVMYPIQLASAYTPPIAAIIPFAASASNVMTKDSGVNDSLWDTSTLGSLVETAFASGNRKLRVDVSNSATPSFTGGTLTLIQARALGILTGRYCHIEDTAISDGDTKVTLYPMFIDCALPAATQPLRPTITNFERTGVTGTCDVSDVNADDDVYAYVMNQWANPPVLVQIGTRTGNGAMPLNYASWYAAFLGADWYFPAPTIFQSKNGTRWSQLAVFVDPYILIENPCTASNYVRNGATASFTLAGLPVGQECKMLYTLAGAIQCEVITANGQINIAGLDPIMPYQFVLIYNPESGRIGVPITIGDDDLPYKSRVIVNRDRPVIVRK